MNLSAYKIIYSKIHKVVKNYWREFDVNNQVASLLSTSSKTGLYDRKYYISQLENEIKKGIENKLRDILINKFKFKIRIDIWYNVPGFCSVIFWLNDGKGEIITAHINVVDGDVRYSLKMMSILPVDIISDIDSYI